MSQQSQLTRELQMIQSSDVAAKQQLALLREEKVSRIDRIDRFICIGSISFSDANSIDFDWHFPPFAHRTRATDTGSTGIAVGSADEERRRYVFFPVMSASQFKYFLVHFRSKSVYGEAAQREVKC